MKLFRILIVVCIVLIGFLLGILLPNKSQSEEIAELEYLIDIKDKSLSACAIQIDTQNAFIKGDPTIEDCNDIGFYRSKKCKPVFCNCEKKYEEAITSFSPECLTR